ncbi:MAG: tRNA (N6-isopentenyl adenosine(37)-C2)-methylthiotransferase MiaB [Clostridia bacterium]|nr:tRNA (N6-isopentenyl adenosine(37)-C2)-methylthiotransferase MiaB [Clostridia bacterium]
MLYNIVTYGCQMNVHESEKIAGILEKMGYKNTNSREDADIVVFNTCAIREGAEDRAFGNIGALKKSKKQNPNKLIIICGCMTQQKHIAENLFKTFPFVDIILGTHNIHLLETLITRKQKEKKRILDYMESSNVIEGLSPYRTSGDNAWVNIMYGCNNFCTYCIVPYVRGRERSRKKEDILTEIRDVIKTQSYKTITLLGQNVNSYGNDDSSQGSFAELLADICKLEGDFKVTFMTSHPKDLSDELIDVMKNNDKIVKEIHLPVQSGSNNILKLMNRKYTREHYLSLIEKLRTAMPNIRITTDLIVGFPTETEEDFNDTCDLVKTVKYDGIFAFMYSKRSGTVAEKMEGQVEDCIKNKRVNYLLNLEKEIKALKEGK